MLSNTIQILHKCVKYGSGIYFIIYVLSAITVYFVIREITQTPLSVKNKKMCSKSYSIYVLLQTFLCLLQIYNNDL